jgi:hypothetical protein
MREALKFFKNTNQEHHQGKQNEDIVQEFLQLLKEKHSVGRLLDLLNILREYKEGQRPSKYVRQLSYKHKYYDPQVDLEIHRVMIEHVVVDFGSQVNILPRGHMDMVGMTFIITDNELPQTCRPNINRTYRHTQKCGNTNYGYTDISRL